MLKIKTTVILIGATLLLSGCGAATSTTTVAGSLFRSDNAGVTWTPKSSIMGVNKTGTFAPANIWDVYLDPTDTKTVYVSTSDNGLFISNDSGESWEWAKSLNKLFVRSVAVDPQYRCTILAAVGNKLYKSIDCARSFVQTYYDNDPAVTISTVITDPKDGSKVYLATSRGEIIKSSDRGASWRTINRFDSKVIKLFVNPQAGNYLYAATANDGLNVSNDGGSSWQSLKDNLKSFNEGTNFKDLAFSGTDPAKIMIATRYGILFTTNQGRNWSKIDLITPKDKATINAMAVDPTNDNIIYYSTNTTFYSSKDGGKNWTTKALPSARIGWKILINPSSPNVIFMGVRDAG